MPAGKDRYRSSGVGSILEDEVATEVVYDVHRVTKIHNNPMIRLVKISLNIKNYSFYSLMKESTRLE
ncbi:hypothetical protein [Bacillus toyonensis]|uniref:hypothetical protein n=1 Tax=Bacillus toyonensis TaxID=155322 RepID=UPI0021B3A575|nr:hypothetical protein [Bacillus toyonensis]